MANRWSIPKEVELVVLDRDANCVYCGITFTNSDPSRKNRRTWEHIINDIRINGPENIALYCGSGNASKGSKTLEDWLRSKYCDNKNINKETVADVVKRHLDKTSSS